jgi:hypothetical protein
MLVMDFPTTNRRILPWASLALVGLALAVFAWGTGYKLSLYNTTNSKSHLIPHAKLLSKDQQPSVANEVIAQRGKENNRTASYPIFAVLFLCILLAAGVCSALAACQRAADSDSLRRLRHRASLTFFFALPPPVLA